MKIDFKKIIRYLNPRNVDNLETINPYRDWKLIILFSAAVLFAVLFADGYVLWKSSSAINENIALEEQAAITAVNRASLSKAIETIKIKEEQFKKPFDITITDPSL